MNKLVGFLKKMLRIKPSLGKNIKGKITKDIPKWIVNDNANLRQTMPLVDGSPYSYINYEIDEALIWSIIGTTNKVIKTIRNQGSLIRNLDRLVTKRNTIIDEIK